MSAAEFGQLLAHFLSLSLLAFGGAMTVAPEMHRFAVGQHGWLTDEQFTASIALAQSSPGPNILFVTLIGWNAAGAAGALAATVGILLPSSALSFLVHRWTRTRSELPVVRAFRAGMGPITIGLLLATAWILTAPNATDPVLVALALLTVPAVVLTRTNPLWLIIGGAIAGVAASLW